MAVNFHSILTRGGFALDVSQDRYINDRGSYIRASILERLGDDLIIKVLRGFNLAVRCPVCLKYNYEPSPDCRGGRVRHL